MTTKGSSALILNDRQEVLLILREDARIWALPGGTLEPGETHEQAAIREVREETGYDIELMYLIGKYWRPQYPNGGNHMHVFAGRVISGDVSGHDWEAVEVRWFPLDKLPKRVFKFTREHIRDARVQSGEPFERTQTFSGAQVLLMRGFLILRNLRNRIAHRM